MAVKEVDLDMIFEEIGEHRKYHRKMYCLLSLVIMFAAICNTNYIFAAENDTYRCVVPECDTEGTPLEADWLYFTMQYNPKLRRCDRFTPYNTTQSTIGSSEATCSPDNFNTSSIIECENWIFGKGNTVIKEFGIQCHNTKRVTIFTVQNAGLFVCLLVVAFLSDGFGRRLALVVSAFLTGLFGLIRSFSTNYIMFLVFQCLEPTLGSGLFSASFILGIEMVGPKRRVLIGTILCLAYSGGLIVLGAVAWGLPYWRHLLWVIYCPSFLFVSYYWFVDESPRWLISDGQFEKAVVILEKAAAVNGVNLSDKHMDNLYYNVKISQAELEIKSELDRDTEEEPYYESIIEPENKDSMFVQSIKSRIGLIRIIVITFWWVTCTITYYGICKNQVALFDNVNLNFMVISAIDIPAYLTMFLVLDWCGRKPTLVVAFLSSGLICVGLPLLPTDPPWIQMLAYALGRYFISLEFGSLYVYTSEIFPTLLRQSSLGPPLAPQTPFLTDVYVAGIDTYIFGGLSFMSAVLLLTSPETRYARYPTTMKETEEVGRTKSSKPA